MSALSLAQAIMGIGSGSVVGFSLGLVGGGGSILAVPLLVYVVGVANPHIAIGTSAVTVAVNAIFNLIGQAQRRTVKWRCAGVFAAAGAVGALAGSTLGKMMDGEKLLALFAILMLVVAGLMQRNRGLAGKEGVQLGRENLAKLLGLGFAAGALSGFFGIGGGFLIVPGLMLATGMPITNAVASSLLAVAVFGVMTGANYAVSGLVDWNLAALFVAGGTAGGLLGAYTGRKLALKRGMLNMIVASVIAAVAIFILVRSFHAL